MTRDRDETGQYVDTITPEDVLGVFDRVDGPVVTSADVADALECSRDTARRKLGQLVESGHVARRKTAGRVVWWLTDGGTDVPSSHEQAFEAFAEQLTNACGESIERIFLYGSVARGTHRAHSDVDVLIVVKDEVSRETVHEHAATIGFDVMIDYDVLIAENIKTKEEFEEQRNSSYLTTVREEGRAYAR